MPSTSASLDGGVGAESDFSSDVRDPRNDRSNRVGLYARSAAEERAGGEGGALAVQGGSEAAALPAQWLTRLANTMILHTVQNAMRLTQYLLQLLTGGYGTVSALHIACWEGSTDAVSAVTSGSGSVIKEWHSRPGELSPLHIASICGHAGVVEYLLQLDADPNIPTIHGLRPLHISASSSSDLTESLLSGRADPSALTADNDTPLHFACCYQQIPTVELLLRAGVDASSPNNFGVTPLHVAVCYAALEGREIRDARAVLLLCSYRVDLAARDRHGRTPAAVASMAGGDQSLVEFVEIRSGEAGGMEANGEASLRVERLALEMLAGFVDEPEPMPSPGRSLYRRDSSPEPPDDRGFVLEDLDSSVPHGAGRRLGANPQGSADMHLAEENAQLVCELARLQKEFKQKESNHRLLEELLENTQNMMRQMQVMQQTQNSDVMQKQTQSGEAMHQMQEQLELQRRQSRNLQQLLDEGRGAWEEQLDALRRQLADALAARDGALGEARQAAERHALHSSAEELGRRDAELGRKDEELGKKTAELQALKATLERMRAEFDEGTARAETRRLVDDLQARVRERDKVHESLSELRVAHTTLREERTSLILKSRQAEAGFREREVTLEGMVREQGLRIRKLEQDILELGERLPFMEEYRERAELADRVLEPLQQRVQELQEAFQVEQNLRKRYHNQLQDLKGAIRVYARVRPSIAREVGMASCIHKRDAFTLELAGKDRKLEKIFTFDSVFDEHSTQEEVFSECRSLVSSAIDGYNVTVFAYGQTGAGKTYTMYGDRESPGLIPRIVDELFSMLSRYAHECQARVRVSMLELYKDDLMDLILPRSKARSPPTLDIKKDFRGSVFVENATEREVTSAQEILDAIAEGNNKRHVAATKLNADSSRSHLIVTLVVESENKKNKQVATGKLTLCDLAGSERLKKSEATGDQVKEAQSINKSLAALGDVIEALSKNAKHIPYRNNKLTQLLSDSIGGNAKTLMFVNTSPAADNADETNSSLSYAVRAKLIVNKVEKTQDSTEVARLKKVIHVMSQELEQARGGQSSAPPAIQEPSLEAG